MADTKGIDTTLEEQLAAIEEHVKELRHDVARILQAVQNELEASREREFWRDYGRNYQQE